jgi:hypothetical protein
MYMYLLPIHISSLVAIIEVYTEVFHNLGGQAGIYPLRVGSCQVRSQIVDQRENFRYLIIVFIRAFIQY